MFFRKKIISSAILCSLLSISVFAKPSITTDTIQDYQAGYQKMRVFSPEYRQKVALGDPIFIDFGLGRGVNFKALYVNGKRVTDMPEVSARERFKGELLGATDKTGVVQIEFLAHSWQFGSVRETVQVNVSEASTSASTATLDVSYPLEGEIYSQGDEITIQFTLPDQEYRMRELSIGGRAVNVIWDRLPPSSSFSTSFRGYLDKPGPQKVIFSYYRLEDGKNFRFERNILVQQTGVFSMQVVSPTPYQIFNQGDIMPIEAVPTPSNKNPHFIAFVDGLRVGEMNTPPYRYDYRVTQDFGLHSVRIDEYDAGQILGQENVEVRFAESNLKIETSLSVKQGTSAVVEGADTTIVANVKGYRGQEVLPETDVLAKIAAVEFYVNDELVGRDETFPYEFRKVYSNDASSISSYSTQYQVKPVVKVNDEAYKVDIAAARVLEAMPAAGANYCSVQTPTWSATKVYQTSDNVQFNGFYYTSNYPQQGQQPSFDPNQPGAWAPIMCSSSIISKTGIKVSAKDISATPGQTVTIEGYVEGAIPDVSFERLVLLENDGYQRDIPTSSGQFSFEHLFKGDSSCLQGRCDKIRLYAVNNLGYANLETVQVIANNAPQINFAFAKMLQSGDVEVQFFGDDDDESVTVSVLNGKTQNVIVSENIATRYGQVTRYFNGIFRFAKPANTDKLTLVVTDSSGIEAKRNLTIFDINY